ncbi:MAG TPA: 6-pyruvoyl-tetrahydropterin synthase-related protein [Terriglobales bacterium]|nr:6-pyruvoyl-tetrahydropterin synthase-related protein [Terriglobales bacterium]
MTGPSDPAIAPSAPDTLPGGPLFGPPLWLITATALGVLVPSFFLGIISGHDFEFHMNSWMEVLSQWKRGILYPRWAGLAHYGFGEPRFVFYPPLSWFLGAALGSFLPWKIVPSVHQWIALALSGCSMFLLARRFMERRSAIFAAALYVANPYYIVIVYWRSDFAELLAGALLPLLLLNVLRSEQEGRKIILPLALIVAAVWLMNLPSAVLATYSLVLLIVFQAILHRSLRPLWVGTSALLLGLALAAFFVLPAAYEQKWVEIVQVLSPGVRPQDNFLFTNNGNLDHDRFNLLVSVVTTAQIVLLLAAGFLSRRWRDRTPEIWLSVVAWGAAASFLTLRFSFIFYRILPELQFIQLPWRWLLCMNVSFALLVTLASQRWLVRGLACIIILAVLVWVWHWAQPPWWDTAGDVAEMQDNQEEGVGYESVDEYVPAGGDAYEINKDARRVTYEGAGNSRIRVTEWTPESITFSAYVSQPGQLVLKLFNYPAWRAELNGHNIPTLTRPVTAQMMIPVEAGESRVHIRFTRTPDRTLGGSISFVAGLVVLGMFFAQRVRLSAAS